MMDRDRFDALARLFAAKGSRRAAVSALLGASLLQRSPAALAKPGKGGVKSHSNRKQDKPAKDGKGNKGDKSTRHRCCGAKHCVPPTVSSNRSGCDFSGQSLTGNYRSSHLSQIDGRGADFSGADLRASSLSGACLSGADLRGADLRGASLEAACLVDANLSGAKVDRSTNLTQAIFCRTVMPDGSTNDAGCRHATRCCLTCDATAECCADADCHDPDRPRCRAGQCVARAGSGRCPIEVCQNGERDPQGDCVYTDSPDNQPGPACTESDRFCCKGHCCQAGDICTANGCCTPDPPRTTCIGRCDVVTNNCGQQVDCQNCAERSCQIGACSRTTCQYADTQDGVPGPKCPAPFFCCHGDCCRQGDVCTANGCCTPDSNQPCQGKCGKFTDNCGQQFDCGACPQVICQTVTCNPDTHVCDHATQPNLTRCVTEDRRVGICCNGTCVLGGACCAAGDCRPNIPCQPNQCQNNQCVPVTEPDRTTCQGDFGTGICCGGFCFSDPNNQVCCQTDECPDKTCHITACSDHICQPDLLIPNGQQGPGCRGTGEFCCQGHCCASGQRCDNGACTGPIR
jgi:hypothetical protein